MPIILADGTFFGTLCALDPRPAQLDTPETIGMFKLFPELIAIHLEAVDRLAASEARLLSERETSELARAIHRRARPRSAQSARLDRRGGRKC
jgi:GAF domain-containing protein